MPIVTPKTQDTKTIIGGKNIPKAAPVVEAVAEDAPTLEAVEPTEVTDEVVLGANPDEPKLVELARRTKAQRAMQVKLQQDQAELEQRKLELTKKDSEYQTNFIPKDRLKTDLLGVLTELGYDSKMLSEAFNSQPVAVDVEIRGLKKQIEELKAAAQETTENFKQDKASQYEQAISKIRSEVKQLVKTDVNFETIKDLGEEESVVEFIKNTFEHGHTDKEGNEYPKGHIFSVSEAAQLIEDNLIEDSIRRANLNKVKLKMAPVAEEPTKIPTTNSKIPIKTLTNTMSGNSAPKTLSKSERRARAIAIASGQLPPS